MRIIRASNHLTLSQFNVLAANSNTLRLSIKFMTDNDTVTLLGMKHISFYLSVIVLHYTNVTAAMMMQKNMQHAPFGFG